LAVRPAARQVPDTDPIAALPQPLQQIDLPRQHGGGVEYHYNFMQIVRSISGHAGQMPSIPRRSKAFRNKKVNGRKS
jgi:hypothetical protein